MRLLRWLWSLLMPPKKGNAGKSSASATVPASPRRRIGMNANPLHAVDRAALVELGVRQVRTTFYWLAYIDARTFDVDGHLYPDGAPPYHTPAEWYALSLAQMDPLGIETLILVSHPPASLTTLASGIAAMPSFMAGLVTTFPGRTWEILNEMDGEDSFNNSWFHASDGGYTQAQRGTLYGTLLGPVYDAMKAADPTCTVNTGALASRSASEQVAFYNALAAQAPGRYDAVDIHFYGLPADLVGNCAAMRAVIGGRELWVTEFGYGAGLTDQQQFDYWVPTLNTNDADRTFDRGYMFSLVNNGDGYGVMESDGTKRPAYWLFRGRSAA